MNIYEHLHSDGVAPCGICDCGAKLGWLDYGGDEDDARAFPRRRMGTVMNEKWPEGLPQQLCCSGKECGKLCAETDTRQKMEGLLKQLSEAEPGKAIRPNTHPDYNPNRIAERA